MAGDRMRYDGALRPVEDRSKSEVRRESDAGFTLIELMICVGIIGILIGITGPAYSRYQAKAKQSEAKLMLAVVYGLERGFYTEYAAYIPSLKAIGYEPEGARRWYYVGWNNNSLYSHSVTGYSNSLIPVAYGRAGLPGGGYNSGCPDPESSGTATDGNASPFDTDNPQAFKVRAIGAVRSGGICDMWEINELKSISNIQSGL